RAFERSHPRSAVLGRQHDADEIERGHLLPHLGGVTDGIVFEGAHCLERRIAAARAAHHRAQHFLFFGEIEIHYGRQSFPRRRQGLSSSWLGSPMRAEQSVLVSPSTASVTSTLTQPQPASSTPTSSTTPDNTIVSPGNTDPFMRNFMRPGRPFGPDQSVR